MLDIHYIREHAEELKQNILNRQLDPKKFDVEKLLNLDKKRIGLVQNAEALRKERNAAAESRDLEKGKHIKEELKKIEPELDAVTKEWQILMDLMPNAMHESMPVGKDSSGNKEIKTWGDKPKFDFEPKDHLTLGEKLGIIDVKRAAEISGSRFYFLKGAGALLDFALTQYALSKLRKRGFIPVITPVLVREKALYGTGYFPAEADQIYKVDKSNIENSVDLYLTGTSEQALVAYESNSLFSEKDLPVKYAGYSSCFRSEAGSWGKDVRGIKRVHQFTKVEMIYFTTPEDSQKYMKEALDIEEELLQELKLPYHILEMCSGDVGLPTYRKFDVEVWMPSQNDWMEVQSNSDLAQYHSRRLNIRYRKGDKTDYVHTISATAITNTRPIAAILENYQTKEGKVKVPKALQEYMGEKEIG